MVTFIQAHCFGDVLKRCIVRRLTILEMTGTKPTMWFIIDQETLGM